MTLLIFDLNGTIVDSEEAHWSAYSTVLKTYGIDFTLEEFTADWTTKGKKLEDTLKKHGREDLISKSKEIKSRKDIEFTKHSDALITLMPGAKEALERLKPEFKLTLDSTSAQKDVQMLLDRFGLTGYFSLFTSADTPWDEKKYGEKNKASRFKYISDAEKTLASECVVIGDAEKDVAGANKNGMKSIAVPNQYTKDNDFSKASLVIESLNELDSKKIKQIV